MPTKRAWSLLLIAAILYFLANQTQVGWIYVFVAAIIGLIGVAFGYDWGILKKIELQRQFRHAEAAAGSGRGERLKSRAEFDTDTNLTLPTFYEDQAIEVMLQFDNRRLRPAFLLSGREECPFAPPADQTQPFFIPMLSRQQPLTLSYQTLCDRRGLYTFPDLTLQSEGPFGLFKRQRRLVAPGNLLVYPRYHPLKRLRRLEQREFGQRQTARAGLGTQVLGVRDYRPGDLLRHVHWRSTARRNRLVVKEFGDDNQLSLTVVLDLERGSNLGQGKFSTFETAARLAASFGYYAAQNNMPFYLLGAGKKWPPPKTALSWWATLNYLAKAQNDGQTPLAQVIHDLPAAPVVVVLISNPQAELVKALASLRQKSSHVWAIFISLDGLIPEAAKAIATANLHIKSATADNWPEMLEGL